MGYGVGGLKVRDSASPTIPIDAACVQANCPKRLAELRKDRRALSAEVAGERSTVFVS